MLQPPDVPTDVTKQPAKEWPSISALDTLSRRLTARRRNAVVKTPTSAETKPDPADRLDYRLDAGPPPKRAWSVTLTVSFQTLKRILKRVKRW
jgi:hypothetical protein